MSLILDGTNGLSDVDGSAATPAIRGTDTNTGIFFPAADTIAFSEGGTEVARIDSAGNLGIGTSSPRVKVDNTGSFRSTGVTDPTSGAGLELCYRGTVADVLSYNRDTSQFTELQVRGNPIAFLNAGGERMRITSGGDLYIGGTTGTYGSRLTLFSGGGGNVIESRQTGSGAQYHVIYMNSNGAVGSIQTSGSSTSYVTSSDYRLKENITPMTGALAKVSQLKPVTYQWKVDGSAGEGFIAHELQAVVPDCVTGEKDAVQLVDIKDEEGNVIGQEEKPVYQGIDTSFLVATLTAAIQELKATVDAQAARIAALENPPVESVTNE